jgi:transposase
LNKLFFSLDLIKEKLAEAYRATDEVEMAKMIEELMDICKMTKNEHFRKFYRLLDNHFEGIIAHATYRISAGKIEGINNRIKTIRRQGYGYPDDDYFFLKVFDSSRKTYVRNPGSNKIPQNL